MSWVTVEEAKQITGQDLTEAQLTQAYEVIEIDAGVTTAARDRLKPRDLRLLKKAEAFQAAWMAAQVDYTGRSDTDLVSQDGLQFSKGDPDMHLFAPLAVRCLRRLSWRRSRHLNALTPTQALVLRGVRTQETYGVDADEVDGWGDGEEWRPL